MTLQDYAAEFAKKIYVKPEHIRITPDLNDKFVVKEDETQVGPYLDEKGFLETNGRSFRVEYFREFHNVWCDLHTFRLVGLPGCCGVCVSTEAYTSTLFRGKGVNQLGNQLRESIAKAYGYSTILATTISDNVPERNTLYKRGFKEVHAFRNRRTANNINVYVKSIA